MLKPGNLLQEQFPNKRDRRNVLGWVESLSTSFDYDGFIAREILWNVVDFQAKWFFMLETSEHNE